jgi:hypothetical protein
MDSLNLPGPSKVSAEESNREKGKFQLNTSQIYVTIDFCAVPPVPLRIRFRDALRKSAKKIPVPKKTDDVSNAPKKIRYSEPRKTSRANNKPIERSDEDDFSRINIEIDETDFDLQDTETQEINQVKSIIIASFITEFLIYDFYFNL